MRPHLLLLLALTACAGEPAPKDSAPQDTAPQCELGDEGVNPLNLTGVPYCGEQAFFDGCRGCHGSDGRGAAPNVEGTDLAEHVPAHGDVELIAVFFAGTGDMPPQELGSQEAADVLSWLRREFGDYDGSGH